MLVVTTDLWPHGDKEECKSLTQIAIANVGISAINTASYAYDYVFAMRNVEEPNAEPIIGVLRGYDRNKPSFHLVSLVLECIVHDDVEIMSNREELIAMKMYKALTQL